METEGFYMAEKRWRTWETVGLLVVLAVLLTMTLRSILSPIRRLQQLMDRMSDTFDLSARANIRGTHEVARMARSFDRLVDAFEQKGKIFKGGFWRAGAFVTLALDDCSGGIAIIQKGPQGRNKGCG